MANSNILEKINNHKKLQESFTKTSREHWHSALNPTLSGLCPQVALPFRGVWGSTGPQAAHPAAQQRRGAGRKSPSLNALPPKTPGLATPHNPSHRPVRSIKTPLRKISARVSAISFISRGLLASSAIVLWLKPETVNIPRKMRATTRGFIGR
jgi:hypothetical protein